MQADAEVVAGEVSMVLPAGVDDRLDRSRVDKIDRAGQETAGIAGQVGKVLALFAGIAVHQHQVGPGGIKGTRSGTAKVAGRSSDHGYLVRKIEHGLSLYVDGCKGRGGYG